MRVWVREHPDENVRGILSRKEGEVFELLRSRAVARVIDALSVKPYKPKAERKPRRLPAGEEAGTEAGTTDGRDSEAAAAQ